MAKIGRNEPCLCGSGLKYKKCCLLSAPIAPVPSRDDEQYTFVRRELARLVDYAARRAKSFRLIGALVFFSTDRGDAWLLELVEQDALRVARAGEALEVSVTETRDTLEIGWTHRFAIEGHRFVTTSYLDDQTGFHEGCPLREIRGALEQIRRQHPAGKPAISRLDPA